MDNALETLKDVDADTLRLGDCEEAEELRNIESDAELGRAVRWAFGKGLDVMSIDESPWSKNCYTNETELLEAYRGDVKR